MPVCIKSMPDGPLFPVDVQCGFLHKVSTDIAHNPLHFRGGFGSELRTRIQKERKNYKYGGCAWSCWLGRDALKGVRVINNQYLTWWKIFI